ncbi:1-O-acylceramide synthase [Entamoeba marina]
MFALLCCLLTVIHATTCERKPVIIVPGIMSSILDIKLDIPEDSTKFDGRCQKTEDWDRLWASYKLAEKCYTDYMQSEWNSTSNQMHDPEGVQIRAPDFGKTYAVDTLWPQIPWKKITGVWHTFIGHLTDLGYKDGVDMMAAPYDWRYTQSKPIDDWLEQTKQLLQTSFEVNGRKAVIISSSMGGYVTYRLLDYLGKEFCDQYVDQWIAISMPVQGSAVAVKMITVGEDVLHLNLEIDKLLNVIQSIESVVGLLPIDTIWDSNDVIATIEETGEVYTVKNIHEFIQSIPKVKEFGDYVYENTLKPYYVNNNYKVPNNVPLNCIISNGIETIESIDFKKSYDSLYSINYGDGDGMVNYNSLQACSMFTQNVTNIGKSSHNDILKKTETFEVVQKLICN